MKTLITQTITKPATRSRNVLPALLVALLSFCGYAASAQIWTIGTGTSMYASTSYTPAPPLGQYYPTTRVQYMYTKAELNAAGLFGPMVIHQIAWNVGSLNGGTGQTPNFNISMGHSTLTALPTTAFVTTGMANVYSGSYTAAAIGWNNITLSTPFNWNGVDNIIIEECNALGVANYANNVTGNYSAGVYYSSVSSGLSTYAYQYVAGTLCGLATGVTVYSTTTRPNIRFIHLSPCLGLTVAGTITPSGTQTVCPGTSVTLYSSAWPTALNTSIRWVSSPNGTTWTNVALGVDRITTPPLTATTYYKYYLTCTNSGQVDSTAVTIFNLSAAAPVYAALPFYEGFESWVNGCSTTDRPSNNWTNIPFTGNSSWRREDQGASASWTASTQVVPAAKEGAHSARWHGSYAPAGPNGQGTMMLYINASATTGDKELRFWYDFKYPSATATAPGDSLIVEMSTNAGATFSKIYGALSAGVGVVPDAWNYVAVPNLVTTSANTIFRIRAKQVASSSSYDDVYLDGVRVLDPCSNKPVAGTIDSVSACPGKTFGLKLSGTSLSAGLTYIWQYLSPGGWVGLPGGNIPAPTTSITAATSYRAIVTCGNSSLSDTSKTYTVQLAPFYYCYCAAVASYFPQYGYGEVGNVSITTQPAGVYLLNNGNATPTQSNPAINLKGYTDYRFTVPPPTLVRDSTYRISTSQISGASFISSFYGVAWLDSNRDGQFTIDERILSKPIPSVSNPTVSATFKIGSFQKVGLTGLRVIVTYSVVPNPCGAPQYYGEVEDYLVRIEYQPCSGPVNPGITLASDTSVCPGYTIDLADSTYDKTHTNILRQWQISTDGGSSFYSIPGAVQKDTILNLVVNQASQYRLAVICNGTGDTTYSNAVNVATPIPVRCYPRSWASRSASDSSDIGAFVIGDFINPLPGITAGPHLMNPQAVQRRTDYTLLPPIELNADSTYRLAIFHTMPHAWHANALVSVFIDYNNNFNYDLNVPPGGPYTTELAFQGITYYDSFYLDTRIKIPSAVIPNVPTGLRVVLNNNTDPLAAGNTGAGDFISGEVEDYVVIFRRWALGTGTTSLLQNLALYPNPTEGKFTVLSDAGRAVSHLDVIVSTITGQQVISRSFDNVGTHFSTQLDLSNQAKGVYFVEIRADGEKITKKLIVR